MEFFNDLYHRFLLSPKPAMKAMCLQAMAIVYGQCHEEIGPFNDTPFIVHKLERVREEDNIVFIFTTPPPPSVKIRRSVTGY